MGRRTLLGVLGGIFLFDSAVILRVPCARLKFLVAFEGRSASVQFLKLAKVSDFDRIFVKSYRILGRNVGIVKDKDGDFFATEVSCKHHNADLTLGKFDGDIVVCPRHGWTYNIRTGQCLDHDSSPLRRYALKIEGDDIFVSATPEEPEEIEEDEVYEIKFKKDSRPD